MQARIRALMLAALLCVAAAACTRAGDIAAPDAAGARTDEAPANEGTMPDTSDAGWGGFGGSGG